MKTILLSVYVLTFLLTTSLFANINECKSDLYYANGIMMGDSEKVALTKWRNRVDDLLYSKQNTFNRLANILVSYNKSQWFDDDIYESFEQMMSNEWGWKDFSLYFETYLKTHLIQEAGNQHSQDLTTQVNGYKQSIKNGHGVIVIAHSQGNFFTNEAYEQLDDWMKQYFHMIGVATPADHVAGYVSGDTTAPYVTFHNDFINLVVTGLSSNREDTRHHGFPSIDAHDFYESYLKEPTTKNDIIRFIEKKVDEHTDAPSQWKTDQEYNTDTCDYKITVKHRFDPGIEMPLDVFPFAPNKKLYQLEGGQWIKASCGGTTIMGKDRDIPTWEGKQDNECLMIDNPEEEKIILEKVIKVYIIYKLSLFRDYRDYYANHYTHGAYVSDKKIDTVSNYYDLVDTSCHDERSATLYDNSYYGEATSLYIPRIEESFISTQGNIEEYYYYNRHYAITMPMMAVKNTLDCILEKNNKSLSDIKSIERVGKYNNLFAVEQPPTYWARFWFIEYVINMK